MKFAISFQEQAIAMTKNINNIYEIEYGRCDSYIRAWHTSECPGRSYEIDHRDAGMEDVTWLHTAMYYESTTATYLEILLDALHLLCWLYWLPPSPCGLFNKINEQYSMARYVK